MADEPQKEISGDLATREQAKRDQTQPVPLSLTIQYDPSKTTPPPGEPQAPAAPTKAPARRSHATGIVDRSQGRQGGVGVGSPAAWS